MGGMVMRESQRELIEIRMARGKFRRTHREKEMDNIKIEVIKEDRNNCFVFKEDGKEIDVICIKRY